MFTYCYNNPVIYKDVTGEAATVCIGNDDYDDLFPWNGIDGVGYADEVLGQKLAAVICAGVIVIGGVVIHDYCQSIDSTTSSVDVDMPRDVAIPDIPVREGDDIAIGFPTAVAVEVSFAKAGDGIGEHTNGSKNWDKHTKKRAGGKEKKDSKMKPRQNKKKRNMGSAIVEVYYE